MHCPCQSGESYDLCCGRFITHKAVVENAQQLMRSRYTAYVSNNTDYLMHTWHVDHRPTRLQMDPNLKWIKLDIINYATQGEIATVEFEALFIVNAKVEALREKSQFVREQGVWLYTTGEMMEARNIPWKPGRNNACPCNSGLKFKRCCGK